MSLLHARDAPFSCSRALPDIVNFGIPIAGYRRLYRDIGQHHGKIPAESDTRWRDDVGPRDPVRYLLSRSRIDRLRQRLCHHRNQLVGDCRSGLRGLALVSPLRAVSREVNAIITLFLAVHTRR